MGKTARRYIVILHGWAATENSCWYQRVGKHYTDLGCQVLIPKMPEPYAPNLNKWAAKVKQVLKENNWTPDDSLSLIGHSTGVLAAMRYIEKLPVDVHIGPCVFVAGFPASLFHPDLPVLLARSPVVSQIKPKLKQLIAVHSTNDWRVPAQANGKWFEEKLDAQVIIFERAGHFTKRSGWRDWNDDLYREADRLFGFVSGQNH